MTTSTTPRLRALGHDFDVATPDPALTRHLTDILDPFRVAPATNTLATPASLATPATPATGTPPADTPDPTDAPATRHYELVGPDAAGQVELRLDGEPVEPVEPANRPVAPAHAVALLLWRINRGVIEDTDDLVMLHAGAVVVDGVTVLLPGDTGAGKSTLVAGLLRAGADYLTDEAVGLELDGPLAYGVARPISLDPGSWGLFPDLAPPLPDDLVGWLPPQWQVRADRIPGVSIRRSAEPGVVALLRYRAGAPTEVRRLPGSEALTRLGACTFPNPVDRVASLARLARLVEEVACHEVVYGDLGAGVEVVASLARDAATGTDPRGTGARYDHADPVAAHPPRHDPAAGPLAGLDRYLRVRPRPDTTLIRVADEAVVYAAGDEQLHRLNPGGVVVWERLDGRRSLGEVVTALSRDFGVPEATVARDTAGFVSDLLARRLLTKV